jgi:hypothetical protein
MTIKNASLGTVIKYLYPVNDKIKVRLDDYERGSYISEWDDSLGEKPSESELVAQYETVARQSAQEKIEQRQTIQEQINDLKTRIETLEGKQ